MKRFLGGLGLACVLIGLAFADNPTPTNNLQRACTQPECKWINDNFTILDGSSQQRVDAAYNGVAAGLVVNATNLANGIGIVVENDRANPMAYDAAFPFWIGASSTNTQPSIGVQIHDDTPGDDGVIVFRKGRGTLASPAVVQANDILGTLIWQGWDGQAGIEGWRNSTQGGVAAIEAYAAETYSGSAHGSSMKFFTIPLTSSTLGTALYLSPGGNAATNALLVGNALTDPSARVHVYEPLGALNTVVRLETETTGDNPLSRVYQTRATAAAGGTTNIDFDLTAGAAPACPASNLCLVEARTICRCTSGSSCAAGAAGSGGSNVSMVTVKNTAGTIAIQGAVTTPSASQIADSSLTSLTLSVSSPSARMAVVVPANFNHSCHITYQVENVGT